MKDICIEAGLDATEIAQVELCMQGEGEELIYMDAYEKLFNYFCDSGEMPYGVAKAKTGDPDLWILEALAACKSWQSVV